jgi:hypothetical protein
MQMPLQVPFGAIWASFLLATSISAGHAASLTSSGAEGKTVFVLSGEIASGDTDRLLAEVKTAMNDRRVIAGVQLSSPGGDVGEGFKLARVVRDARIATIVPDGAMCASACFIVFAAGSEKFASYAARLSPDDLRSMGATMTGRAEQMPSASATVSRSPIDMTPPRQ